jgi:hypothetical protein
MQYVYDDGGRRAAGYKGEADDCVCRAIAIATGKPYQEVYDALNVMGKEERLSRGRKSSARTGVFKPIIRQYMLAQGWHWTPTMKVGQGCKVHLTEDELPMGNLVVSLSRHMVAVIDRVIHDNHDPSRFGNRCVYGFFSQTPSVPVNFTLAD